MNENHSTDSIQQAVLEKVRAGKVRRRPRWQFILRVVATIVVSVLLLIIAAFVASFVIFSLQESGEQSLLGFGPQGISVFIQLFPWLQAVLVLILLVILQWLLQGFKFAYRIPLLNIFLGIIGVSLVLGVVLNFTPLHDVLLGSADKGHLPVIGEAYEHIFDSHENKGVCRGEVVSVNQNSFVMYHNDHDHDADDGTFTIQIPPGSNLPMPHAGDTVIVFADPSKMGCSPAQHIQILQPDPH